MDLRTGETVWRLKNGAPDIYPPLLDDVKCDIAIVGGGVSGALISYELVKAGFDCVLIDKREVGAGSTSASTALLLYELDTQLFKLAEQIGEEEAAACYKASFDSVGRLGQIAGELKRELGTSCDFLPRKSFYVAERKRDFADLEREHKIRLKHGIPVDLLDQAGVEKRFSFSRHGALVSNHAAEIDVVRFTEALMAAAVARGLRLHGGTTLESHSASGGKVTLHTTSRHRITARRLIFATGYESEKYLGRKVGKLISTYAAATEPIDDFTGWHERALIWTTARPYLYLRTTRDNRAIIGGGDIECSDDKVRDALLPKKTAMLEKQLREFFPEMKFQLSCAWAGTFGETEDSLARIGSRPGQPHTSFALGYGGNGITYSMLAADILRETCLGRKHPAAELFRLDR